jgi:hypothetical protein
VPATLAVAHGREDEAADENGAQEAARLGDTLTCHGAPRFEVFH